MSKLVNCKACGNQIAKGTKHCPSCGKDNRNFFVKHKIITALLVLFIIGCIGSVSSNNEEVVVNNNSEAKQTEVKILEEKEEKVPDYSVSLEGGAYDELEWAYYITGTLTNNKKDVDYIQILIPVYDADGNKLGNAIANCNNLKKGETWRFEAMAMEDGIVTYSEDVDVTGF